MAYEVVVEHLNHLGIVAEVCQEIGVAEWLNAQAPTSRQQVSVGTATVAMVLNGLGFSNRQLYLVPQFFEDKPIEHLLGPGITAADLNDDCLGRTLDWLYAHDITTLFAGLALRARRAFGIAPDASACGHDVVLGEWGVPGASGGGARCTCDRGDLWLLTRSPRGPQAVDAGAHYLRRGGAALPQAAEWQRQ